MFQIRLPGVAGAFYPEDPKELNYFLDQVFSQTTGQTSIPRALIVPHAGYIYSGLVAAKGYACLKGQHIDHVAIFAPAHRVSFQGTATSDFDFFATPLADVPVARDFVADLLDIPSLKVLEVAFNGEHALEVQLPFLQKTLKNFHLLPFLVGQTNHTEVAKIIDRIMNVPNTLIVISSDLSHYLDYQSAQTIDHQTIQSILALDPQSITDEQACGRIGIKGLLEVAKKRRLKPQLIDYKNSGDTAGDKQRVVGYAAIHFYDAEEDL